MKRRALLMAAVSAPFASAPKPSVYGQLSAELERRQITLRVGDVEYVLPSVALALAWERAQQARRDFLTLVERIGP